MKIATDQYRRIVSSQNTDENSKIPFDFNLFERFNILLWFQNPTLVRNLSV